MLRRAALLGCPGARGRRFRISQVWWHLTLLALPALSALLSLLTSPFILQWCYFLLFVLHERFLLRIFFSAHVLAFSSMDEIMEFGTMDLHLLMCMIFFVDVYILIIMCPSEAVVWSFPTTICFIRLRGFRRLQAFLFNLLLLVPFNK